MVCTINTTTNSAEILVVHALLILLTTRKTVVVVGVVVVVGESSSPHQTRTAMIVFLNSQGLLIPRSNHPYYQLNNTELRHVRSKTPKPYGQDRLAPPPPAVTPFGAAQHQDYRTLYVIVCRLVVPDLLSYQKHAYRATWYHTQLAKYESRRNSRYHTAERGVE